MSDADRAQREAADISASAWVDASAGSGKTKVLVDRLLRLLLGAGEPPAAPQRILCLTFTNAAAAEMANRLNQRLADWAVASEQALSDSLAGLLGEPANEALRIRARELLPHVLDAPGGMRIQTLHGFCDSLLRRFPLEAGVPPYFDVLDEPAAAATMAEAQNATIASLGDDAELRDALAIVTLRAHETRASKLLNELVRERGRLRRLIQDAGGFDGLVSRLHESIGIERGADPEEIVRAACADGSFAGSDLRALAQALKGGSKGDNRRGAAMAAWLALDEERRTARFDSWMKVFLTGEGAPRKTVATKAIIESAPGIKNMIKEETRRLLGVEAERRRAVVAGATTALLTLGNAILESCEARKRARGRLDFDDLILSARDLLTKPGKAEWVLYKLDGGLDHLLIDEAQDTSPEQWEVVRALTDEFFAGEGARDKHRTVFAVGDPKQSIYGFQGADPAKFSETKAWFQKKAGAARQEWRDVPLEVSFRSVAPVLRTVDEVFARTGASDGLTFDNRPVRHRAHRKGQAGMVEIWPPEERAAAETPEPWKPPVERIPVPSALDKLAARVAERIAALCDGAHELESRGRTVRPGDILVLVRRRNKFVDALVRGLRQRDVPVAGVDRLVLKDHIAVMDLIALGRFLLLPGDSLSLAEALKSPLFRFDDDDLFELAHDREGSLWARLRERAEKRPLFAEAAERLRKLLSRADRVTPYALFADLLATEGRRLFLSRLGDEANEPLDEFLSQALVYERSKACESGNVPGLQGFLHWLETGKIEIKRDHETGGGAVRVMTVHGAKGLEAPIVFLPDTMQKPRRTAQLVWAPDRRLVLWPVRKQHWDTLSAEWRETEQARDLEEYRRLLYVAMTRAEDRLIVCGWETRAKSSDRKRAETSAETWHAMARKALGGEEDGKSILRRQSAQTAPPDRADAHAAAATDDAPPPPWLRTVPPAERVPAPRAPSGPGGAARDDEAAARGERLHRLAQAWPKLPETALEADRALVEAAVERVCADPVFAPVFGPGSLAEVPVAAAGPRALSGRIDRLAVTPGAVLAVDFKTGGTAANEARPPAAYLRQMAAYRGTLRGIFPGRPIRCALVWLDRAGLTPLDDATLDRYTDSAPPLDRPGGGS